MIAKLEGTKSYVQQNIEKLQTPTIGVTINKSTTTKSPHSNGQQPKPPGGGGAKMHFTGTESSP